jgi:hypothetical protein
MLSLPTELLGEITQRITCGSDWKAWQLTCCDTYHITEKYYSMECNFTDHQISAFLAYNLEYMRNPSLARNPNMTVELITQHLTHYNLTGSALRDRFQNYEKYYMDVLQDPNLSDKELRSCYSALSQYVQWEYVLANMDKPWEYVYLSKNRNITWDIITAYPDKPWDYRLLSGNPNLSPTRNIWSIVEANPTLPWCFHRLSMNPNLSPTGDTWGVVAANPCIECYYVIAILLGKLYKQIRNYPKIIITYRRINISRGLR